MKTITYTTESGDNYTDKDFLKIAKGNKKLAKIIYNLCEWQHPETVFQELLSEGEINEKGEILTDHQVKFKKWNCIVEKTMYQSNDRTCLELTQVETGEPIAVATVNVPEYNLPDGHVLIKDYSENEGIAEALVNAKIIEPTNESIEMNWVTIKMYKLLI